MTINLGAQTRESKEKLNSDFMPGVLYGKDINQNLKIKRTEFDKVFKAAGESNLINLDFGSGQVKVLVKETQKDVIKNFFTHVDFYRVDMKEKITTEIPLNFIGESSAVRELGGVLMCEMDVLAIECLPGDLVDHIDIDISILKTFSDAIRVNNIKLPAGLSLAHSTNDMVAAVKEPRAQIEEPVAEVVSEKEVSDKKDASENTKKEGSNKDDAKK